MAEGVSTGNPCMYVTDRVSGITFLVGTGAVVSVLPATDSDKLLTPIENYRAVNGTDIPVCKKKRMTLDIGLHQTFTWTFMVPGVTKPILGADFLQHFDLRVDMRHQMLIKAPPCRHSWIG